VSHDAKSFTTVESSSGAGFVEERTEYRQITYFDGRRGGFSVEETAEALQVSPQTVMRDWKLARAWLALELGRAPE
jgi:hypothetical protein